jgi:TP901 family phage tail tape measure protein
MAETTREMVVRLTMDAGGFKKTADEIKKQIRNIDSEIKNMGAGDDKKSKLEEKLTLQERAVDSLKQAVDKAKTSLNEASEGADKLAKARSLAGLESQLESAQLKAAALARELSAANYLKFGKLVTNFGAAMVRMGRSFTLYVGGPLAMLGGKAYKTALNYESALTDLAVAAEKPVEEMGALDEQIKLLTERIPKSYVEISTLMATLARAGVAEKDLTKVIEIMAQLEATTDVSAEESAASLIKFMNNTDMTADQMDELASVLFELGRASVATGSEIFGMAENMAATGGLAGFTAKDILALATAFSSMGIDAEAGGTSASKLMKRMQLAAETGKDVEDYTKVMGISAEQFTAAWSGNPAKTMLNFFESLSRGGVDKSVLANLEEMGLTEIRLSRLIAAAAANPEFFQDMMAVADKAFKDTTGIVNATADVYDTAQSKQDIAMNKIENASADVGENVADIVQPIIEKISELVGKFSELDEETQTRWVKIAGGLILFGPAAVGVGNVAKGIGTLMTHIGKVKAGDAVGFFGALTKFITSPVGMFLVAAGGITALAIAISDIKSPSEQIVANLKNIKIDYNKESYDRTVEAIGVLQAYSDALSGEVGEHYKNMSSAVKEGYGTDEMYGKSLGYEAAFTQDQITKTAGKYEAKYDEINKKIIDSKDKSEKDRLFAERETLKGQWDAEVAAAKANYMTQVSALVSGMMAAQPEAKAVLEEAAKSYDLLVALSNAYDFANDSTDVAAIQKRWAEIFTPDIIDKYFPDAGEILPGREAESLMEKLIAQMNTALTSIGGEESLAYQLWQSILGDPLTADLFDQTQTHGVLDGIIELMDWKNAGEQAGMNFVDALTPGLNDAITESIPDVSGAMNSMQNQLVSQAAQMGRAVAAAFNGNLNFSMPNVSGGSVNVNVNSPTNGTGIYQIRRELNNANNRTRRGYGAG